MQAYNGKAMADDIAKRRKHEKIGNFIGIGDG
jgi:hypothetical protein